MFQFVPIAFCAFSGHHWAEFGSVFFAPPIWGGAFFIQSFYPLCSPSLDLFQSMTVLYREAQNWTHHSRCVSQVLSRGEGSPPSTCSYALLNAAQDAIGHLCCKGSCPACSPPGHSGAFHPAGPQPVPVYFSLLNFMGFLSTHIPACRGPSEWQHNQPIPVRWNVLACCCGFGILHYRALFRHGSGYRPGKVFSCLFSIFSKHFLSRIKSIMAFVSVLIHWGFLQATSLNISGSYVNYIMVSNRDILFVTSDNCL